MYSVEHLGGMFSYMEEQQAIKDHRKEYRKKYYADRRQEVHNNLMRARGAKLADEALQGHHSESCAELRIPEMVSSATQTQTVKKPVVRRTRGKRLFDSDGLMMLHCKNCERSKPKVNYRKETKCDGCNADFKFQCTKCDLIYKSHMACLSHIKFKHPDAKA